MISELISEVQFWGETMELFICVGDTLIKRSMVSPQNCASEISSEITSDITSDMNSEMISELISEIMSEMALRR